MKATPAYAWDMLRPIIKIKLPSRRMVEGRWVYFSENVKVDRLGEARLRMRHASAGKVGMTGFEPATPSSRTKYATGLRYIPKPKFKNNLGNV